MLADTHAQWKAIDRLEKDVEALRGFLLSVIEAAEVCAIALKTEED
jgi:hypothetical protein